MSTLLGGVCYKDLIMMKKLLTKTKEIYWFLASIFLPVKEGGVILTYHSVGENEAFFTVTPKSFEEQMGFLRKQNWNVLPLNSLVSLLLSHQKIPRKTVVITFDDAYVDILESVLPILEKYQIPATLFVPTYFVGAKMKNSEGYELELMNWTQLKKLAAHPLIDIGSHTQKHKILTEIEDVELLRNELNESKREIENNLNVRCNLFSYPKGKCNVSVQEEVKKVYQAAVGTRPGRVKEGKADLFELCRIGVYEYTTFSKFKFLLKR
jgi:peptidoglycan/xylan/chitin deacetylase (PgdA/CDA1 family)